MTDEWVAGLKVTELKDELKKRNLSTSGVKAVLAQRLLDAIKADQPASKPDSATEDTRQPEQESAEATAQPPAEEAREDAAVHADHAKPDQEALHAEPAAAQPAAKPEAEAKVEPEAKPDAEAGAKPEQTPQSEPVPEPAKQAAADPRQPAASAAHEDTPDEPMNVHALLDDGGDEGTEAQDDEPAAAEEPEPVSAKRSTKQQPEPAKPASAPKPAPAAAQKQADQELLKPASQATESTKAEEDKSEQAHTGKGKRRPIQFQPPERKQSATVPQQPDTAGKLAVAAAAGTPAAASASAATSAKPVAEPDAAAAAKAVATPAREPIAKRLRVDTAKSAATEPGASSAPPTAEGARTRVLYIDGLVRPFTEGALRQLLSQTGTVTDLWMPAMKTHAVVSFETEDQAEATRQAVYLLKWPQGSQKVLQPKFITPEDGEKEKASGGTGPVGATPGRTARPGVIAALKASQQRERGPVGANLAAAAAAAAAADAKAAHTRLEADRDKGKEAEAGKSAAAEDEATDAAAGTELNKPAAEVAGEVAGSSAAAQEPEEDEEKVFMLDDLFRKTVSKPQVYYLPLTEEQVAEKKRKLEEQAKVKAAAADRAERERAEREKKSAGSRERGARGASREGRGKSGGKDREHKRSRSRSRDRGARRPVSCSMQTTLGLCISVALLACSGVLCSVNVAQAKNWSCCPGRCNSPEPPLAQS